MSLKINGVGMNIDPNNPSISAIASFVGYTANEPRTDEFIQALPATINSIQIDQKQFPYLVEKKIKDLSKVDGLAAKVAQKLNAISAEILRKEKNYNPLRIVIEKFGQLFKGHGFRTEGEWIQNLADKCKSPREHKYQTAVNNLTSVSEEINKTMDELAPEDFEKIVKEHALNLTGGKLNIFISKLSDSKRDDFFRILITNPHWFVILSSAYTRIGNEGIFTQTLKTKFLEDKVKLAQHAHSALYEDLLFATAKLRTDNLQSIIDTYEYTPRKETLINSLTLDEFRKLVNEHILKLDDYARADFYSLLKVDTFKNEYIAIILKRNDWFEILNDMSLLNDVATAAVVEKFRANKAFLDKYKNEPFYAELDDRI